jgi:hypothetical protein
VANVTVVEGVEGSQPKDRFSEVTVVEEAEGEWSLGQALERYRSREAEVDG